MEQPLADELVNKPTWGVRGIELDKRARPQHPALQFGVNEAADLRVADAYEACHIAGVVAGNWSQRSKTSMDELPRTASAPAPWAETPARGVALWRAPRRLNDSDRSCRAAMRTIHGRQSRITRTLNMSRTSASHPIRVDWLPTPWLGRVGLTFAPGKIQRDAATGSWERDLKADIERLRSEYSADPRAGLARCAP